MKLETATAPRTRSGLDARFRTHVARPVRSAAAAAVRRNRAVTGACMCGPALARATSLRGYVQLTARWPCQHHLGKPDMHGVGASAATTVLWFGSAHNPGSGRVLAPSSAWCIVSSSSARKKPKKMHMQLGYYAARLLGSRIYPNPTFHAVCASFYHFRPSPGRSVDRSKHTST